MILTHDPVISTLNCKKYSLNDSLTLMRKLKNVLLPVVRLSLSMELLVTRTYIAKDTLRQPNNLV
jgi:hypothetical protein